MNFYVYTKLYDYLVKPSFTYASSVWGNIIRNNACKFSLVVTKRSSNLAAREDMGFLSEDALLKPKFFVYGIV